MTLLREYSLLLYVLLNAFNEVYWKRKARVTVYAMRLKHLTETTESATIFYIQRNWTNKIFKVFASFMKFIWGSKNQIDTFGITRKKERSCNRFYLTLTLLSLSVFYTKFCFSSCLSRTRVFPIFHILFCFIFLKAKNTPLAGASYFILYSNILTLKAWNYNNVKMKYLVEMVFGSIWLKIWLLILYFQFLMLKAWNWHSSKVT